MQSIQAESRPGINGRSWRVAVKAAGSFGLGAAATLLVKSAGSAEALLAHFMQFGPLFLLCLGGMVMMNSWGSRMLEHAAKTAAAQQSLADAVQQIARRDDQASRERELQLNDISFLLRQVHQQVGQIRNEQLSRSAGLAGPARQGGD
jgi:hypothetical protein